MNYRQACIKRDIEALILSPFVLLGKIIGYIKPLKSKHTIFLFFPSADIGGSPKVNADILHLLKNHNPLVIFSKKANNNGFKELFYSSNCKILDLHQWIDNKYYHFMNVIFRGIISTWINQVENPIVFGGECMYFYKIIPHVKKSTKVVELCHLNTWINYTQGFVKYIDLRIASTPKLKRYFEKQYQENGVPTKYLQRLEYIDNWVEIPTFKPKVSTGINVLFVGRGAPQKRVHIISAVAEQLLQSEKNISFTFVGDVLQIISPYVKEHATVFEFITEKEKLAAIYDHADILILTSAFEGLPIVVMDMMARGKVVISTAVDGIPDYITHMQSGILIQELDDEEKIKYSAIDYILQLKNNHSLLDSIGLQARNRAMELFQRELFETTYRNIFEIN